MTLKKIGVLSAAKIGGVLYGAMGLILGALFSLIAVVGAAFSSTQAGGPEAIVGFLFGLGAVVFLPVFYGVIGFVGSAIMAAMYNVIAGFIGGLEVEIG